MHWTSDDDLKRSVQPGGGGVQKPKNAPIDFRFTGKNWTIKGRYDDHDDELTGSNYPTVNGHSLCI